MGKREGEGENAVTILVEANTPKMRGNPLGNTKMKRGRKGRTKREQISRTRSVNSDISSQGRKWDDHEALSSTS